MSKENLLKKWQTRDGREVVLYAYYPKQQYCYHGAMLNKEGEFVVRSWDKDFKFSNNKSDSDLVEYNPLYDLKIDDKVIVWNDDNCKKYKRHLAGVNESGKIICFRDGGTSFSAEGITIAWDNWELPEN